MDKLLTSSQEIVATEGSSIGASWNEVADGEVVSSLDSTAVELGVANNSHSTPNPKTSGPPQKQGLTKMSVTRNWPTGVLPKSHDQKVLHILNKIAKNRETGTVDERCEMPEK